MIPEGIKAIEELTPNRVYPVFKTERLRYYGRRHFILFLWEIPTRWERYVLPLHDYFCQNEIIQFNIGCYNANITYMSLRSSGYHCWLYFRCLTNWPEASMCVCLYIVLCTLM